MQTPSKKVQLLFNGMKGILSDSLLIKEPISK